MYPLKDQCCTIEQAVTLKKLGVIQDSLFYFFPDVNIPEIKKKYNTPDYKILCGNIYNGEDLISIREQVLNGIYLVSL